MESYIEDLYNLIVNYGNHVMDNHHFVYHDEHEDLVVKRDLHDGDKFIDDLHSIGFDLHGMGKHRMVVRHVETGRVFKVVHSESFRFDAKNSLEWYFYNKVVSEDHRQYFPKIHNIFFNGLITEVELIEGETLAEKYHPLFSHIADKDMVSLIDEIRNFYHIWDIHTGNVMEDISGKIKFVDFESFENAYDISAELAEMGLYH